MPGAFRQTVMRGGFMEQKPDYDGSRNVIRAMQKRDCTTLTVRELFVLDPQLELHLMAGEGGLDRAVSRAATLEGGRSFLDDQLQSVQPGDFVVSTIFFSTEHPDRFLKAVHLLVERGAAGLAAKTAQGQELPPGLLEFADEQNFPLFLFDKVLMTDLLFYIHDALRIRRETVRYEQCIRQIMPAEIPHAVILQAISEISPNFHSNYYCAYLTQDASLSFLHLRDILARLQQLMAEQGSTAFFPYDTGLLLMASFPNDEVPSDITAHFRTVLLRYQVPIAHFHCGLSRLHHSLTELDVALVETFSANQLAHYENRNLMCYRDMGIYQLILPRLYSKGFQHYTRYTREVLLEHDRKYNSDLLHTLRTYVDCHGKLVQTAERLFLHVNTVRYRLNKAKELLGENDFYIRAYIFIKANDFLYPEQE